MDKPWMIKEIGRLGLGYKTFVTTIDHDGLVFEQGKLEDGLDIYMWADDFSHRWSIASFQLNMKQNCFELREIGDRLTYPDIDYSALKELITLGHDMLMRVEEELD